MTNITISWLAFVEQGDQDDIINFKIIFSSNKIFLKKSGCIWLHNEINMQIHVQKITMTKITVSWLAVVEQGVRDDIINFKIIFSSN